ncbi:MAG: prepilin-type N-terminal cleavage/methylation domain-containing protein [Brevinematales bacterium]|nr:prepilin-type N-terminal cleavage/methylation domain-containing protein [Brevinematales bacterium]
MKWKRLFPMLMNRLFEIEGFTLTELLVTMTLFALVMATVTTIVVIQLRMMETMSKGKNARALFWHHLETISLQTVQWADTTNDWQWKTHDGRIYVMTKDPLRLREVKSGMAWTYPLQAEVAINSYTNRSHVILRVQMKGISFEETRLFSLGWQKGARP